MYVDPHTFLREVKIGGLVGAFVLGILMAYLWTDNLPDTICAGGFLLMLLALIGAFVL